jgi:glutathione S-transferase
MPQSARQLVFLHVSPWSERARWALDHHGLDYKKIPHVPFLGERRLRRLVGPGKKRATVPVLLTASGVLTESWDIACYADREGKGTPLIPAERESEIRRWNDLADDAMSSVRAQLVVAMLNSPEALDESLPPTLPRWLRSLLRPVTRFSMKWFAKKYGLRTDQREAQLTRLRAALTELRQALASGSPYVLGSFSYADIVMASALQGVTPVDNRYIRLGPGTRRAWTLPEIATEFSDLLAWRDRLYALHRKPASAR